MKNIRINGYKIDGALLVEDPDAKHAFPDASGELRHVLALSQPGQLKSYVKKHPGGLILAGVGAVFFLEPITVSGAQIWFDKDGNAEMHIKDGAESIEKQLAAMDAIYAMAADAAGSKSGKTGADS
jgi:hypothetical protein